MLGEKKSDVFDLIPEQYIPVTGLFPPTATEAQLKQFMEERKLTFPVILKPNIGERGWMVKKADSLEDIRSYLTKIQVDFLIQEFIDYPVELGVFYIKHPGESTGEVTSVVKKGFLSVTGDGESSVERLLRDKERAVLQVDFESDDFQVLKNSVPKAGELVEVEAIGNHCRGTTFFNENAAIDEDLTKTFDELAGQIDGFYFGRFDLRCRSIADLKEGNHFKVLELNGAGAEPGHVYQPGYPILRAYRDILWHLKQLQIVSSSNKARGINYWSFSEGKQKIMEIRAYNREKL